MSYRSNPDSDLKLLAAGRRLHVKTSGVTSAQSCVIFVHGLGGSSTNWGPVIDISGLEKSHSVVTFDLEGHGLSPLSGDEISVASYASSIAAVLDSVGAARVTVVAHSLGGVSSYLLGVLGDVYLLTLPVLSSSRRLSQVSTPTEPRNSVRTFLNLDSSISDQVTTTVLLGPVKSFAPGGVAALTARASTVRAGGLSSIASAVTVAGISSASLSSPLVKNAVLASLLSTPAEGYARACLAAASASDPDYSKITAPVLIIAGAEDKTCPKATVDFLVEHIKGAKVETLGSVGHWLQLEDAEGVAKALKLVL